MASKGKQISLVEKNLDSIDLEEDSNATTLIIGRVLLGKLLVSKHMKKHTAKEIMSRIWSLKGKVLTEELEVNFFKFTFSLQEDKEFIFNNRPWNLNGTHLVLKEWNEDDQISEITFDVSTFFIQVHGLLPKLLNEKNAIKICSTIGRSPTC